MCTLLLAVMCVGFFLNYLYTVEVDYYIWEYGKTPEILAEHMRDIGFMYELVTCVLDTAIVIILFSGIFYLTYEKNIEKSRISLLIYRIILIPVAAFAISSVKILVLPHSMISKISFGTATTTTSEKGTQIYSRHMELYRTQIYNGREVCFELEIEYDAE